MENNNNKAVNALNICARHALHPKSFLLFICSSLVPVIVHSAFYNDRRINIIELCSWSMPECKLPHTGNCVAHSVPENKDPDNEHGDSLDVSGITLIYSS